MLLVAPLHFYSFAGAIKKCKEADGYDVALANDEYPNNIFGKILGKLSAYGLLSKLTRRRFADEVLKKGDAYDICVVVKGRGLSPELVGDLLKVSRRVIGYNFDSFAFNASPLRWLASATKYYTFDIADARRNKLPRLDLFSLITPDPAPKKTSFRMSAILRNHSTRLKYVDRVLQETGETDVFIYIFELNLITFVFNFLSNPALYLKYRKHIHFKSLPYSEYLRVMRESSFTIDFAHPKQSGITMRCFEAAAAQTKIITNNRYVLEHPFFDPSNTIVHDISGGDGTLKKTYEAMSPRVPDARYRSLSMFLDELMA
ncbi:CgeB family protein [Xanthobacter wiegelii]|uniref:hypothetical protein n=1 Tax=Xanthobacter wiegelii TaxID=3119913 RepID=UPI0037273DC7